jgi:hypothetical protein
MASAKNNKEKMPSEDDLQDSKLKEEVESEAEEEIENTSIHALAPLLQAFGW